MPSCDGRDDAELMPIERSVERPARHEIGSADA
jgi:hypothetical protein